MISYDGCPIAKDQCFYCFKTQFDGLFVSPLSHRAFCSTHLPLHQQLNGNDVDYVYLKTTLKPQDEPPSKIMKLEIKQQAESELVDLHKELYHDGQVVEPTPRDLAVIEEIVNSNSESKKQELKSWTQEYSACKHTQDFQQSPIDDVQLRKCHECDLDQNLWICLTCGQLGCGRAQFGGIPGNTHALKHYETTGHPIAVKLGSLSKDVADIYCYACQDEVVFPQLPQLLQTFGIDLNTFNKTEKSLVELQIEQNLKWEFNMVNDDGEELPPVFGSGLTGLKNLGNSCYVSSVVQSLFSLPEYQELSKIPWESLNEQDGLKFQLVKIAKGLTSGEFSKPNQEGFQVGVSIAPFKSIIGANHEEFSSMRQQDAFEFWNYLLDKIDTGIDAHLNDIFRFVTVEKFKIEDSNKVLLKKQVTENLTLPVNVEVDYIDENGVKHYKREDFIDSLIQYLSPEEIDWKSGKAVKTTFIKSFPKYLVTAIQRIQLENWTPIKTDVPLSLPESFDISDFQAPDLLDDDEVEAEDEGQEFEPDQEALNQLLQMGFPENRCKKALYNTGNNSAEVAMNWLFEHMDDPTIDSPLVVKKGTENSIDEAKIQSLMDMGFSNKLSTKALILNNEDTNQAVEWLFSNPDDDGVLLPKKKTTADTVDVLMNQHTSSEYILKAVMCHKGTQVTTGHYVAFIRQGDRWILFNDEKVVDVTGDEKSWQEVEKNGYVYIWERV